MLKNKKIIENKNFEKMDRIKIKIYPILFPKNLVIFITT